MDRKAIVDLIRNKLSLIIYNASLGLSFDIADERMFTMEEKKDLYFVVRFGQGQVNYALSDIPVTIQCVSCLDEIKSLEDILWTFLEQVNYKTFNGITLAFLSPQFTSNFNEIQDGYRATVYVSGNVRVPTTNGAQQVNKIKAGVEYIENFIACTLNYGTQPEPQAFPSNDGLTLSLNRQKTMSVSISFYLDSGTLSTLAKNKLSGTSTMNTKTNLGFYSGSTAIISDCDWLVTEVNIPQELGAYPLITMTLTRA